MAYSASLTAGSLLLDETVRVLNYILNGELELKRQYIIEQNIIKINSEAARKRVLQEIRKRNRAVDKIIWEKFDAATQNERKILLFYVVVRTYSVVEDFIHDVVIDRWKSLKNDITEREIEIFLDKKSGEHPEIETWTATTRAKVIQVVIRILKESGLLVGNKLNALQAPDEFWKLFIQLGDAWFLEFALLNRKQREKIIGLI